jgi:hypothetical protein
MLGKAHEQTKEPDKFQLRMGLDQQAGPHGEVTYDPDSEDGPAYGLLNDWAGIAFLDELDSGPWPHFYGGHRPTGVIVLEDLGAAPQIDHILMGEDAAAAESALTAFVKTLAELHCLTAGHTDRYDEIRQGLGSRVVRDYTGWIKRFGERMEKEGFASAALSVELEACRSAFAEPGPFKVYTHGDPCPDNCLLIDGRLHLLDFEWGEVRHALIDGVYPWIHFPSCWCVNRLPDNLPEQLMHTYRTALAVGIREAEDDARFGPGLVAACVAGFTNNYGGDALKKDSQWGISTVRQRYLLRIRTLAKTAEQFGFSAISDASNLLGDRLDALWSDVELMAIYPAFRSSP